MIDNKDKAILYELSKNSRKSNKEISKNTKLKKDTVNYRIKNLQNNKIIKRYFSEIDYSKLGYKIYKIYIQFQDLSQNKETQMWKYLENHQNSIWIVKCSGRWDAIFAFMANNLTEFNDLLSDFLNKFSKYIQNKQIVLNVRHEIYDRKWLNDSINTPRITKFGESQEKIKVDEKDKIILKELTKNAKTSIVELAKKTELSSPQILYRIKNLKTNKILISYNLDIDLEKIGYQFCKTFLYLKNISIERKKELLDYCAQQKNIVALTETIASWDVELEFEVKTFNQLMEIMDNIRNNFQDIFRSFESIIITKESGRIHLPR